MRKNLTQTADPLRDAVQQLLHIEILCERREKPMEKYTKAQMEVIEFENEDVITASGTCPNVITICPDETVDCGVVFAD